VRISSRQARLTGGVNVDGFIVGWFKTEKHRFGLHRFGQGTLWRVYRWLILSLIAYILARAYLSTFTNDLPNWAEAAQLAFQVCFPQLLLFLILLNLELRREFILSLGFDVQFFRCKI